jgi:hypothetical protein
MLRFESCVSLRDFFSLVKGARSHDVARLRFGAQVEVIVLHCE